MIAEAAKKFPQAHLFCEDAAATHFLDNSFELILIFHLLMHLQDKKVADILSESSRLLEPGGRLIFDFPSAKRRRLFSYRSKGWHGHNSYTLGEIKMIFKDNYTIKSIHGLMFVPIHWIPNVLRKFFMRLDNILCRSRWKEYASYIVLELEKNGI